MELVEALTITGLGMAVVFLGLILTALLITSFAVVPEWLHRQRRAATPAVEPSAAPAAVQGEPVDPEVLSVITAVLEIERRLYHAGVGGRLTIARNR